MMVCMIIMMRYEMSERRAKKNRNTDYCEYPQDSWEINFRRLENISCVEEGSIGLGPHHKGLVGDVDV